jgi:ATP-dependent DNA helicase RecG
MPSLVENHRIEFKEKLTDDLEKFVVAFLNAKGGKIYIGINKKGGVAGVGKPDEIQLKIKDRLKDNIRPSIMGLFDIWTEKRKDKTVVVVNLASGANPPYYIKQKGRSEAGCYIRIGSSAQPMTEEMIEQLLAARYPISLANIISRKQDLTFTQLKIYYAGKHKELNSRFAENLNLKVGNKYSKVAYLFADENRVSIRLAKWAGKDRIDLIQNEEYGDQCLITALNKVLERLDVENITMATKTYPYRIETRLVDSKALREAVINAFAHNDYSAGDTPIFEIFEDRFEITTYGNLLAWIGKEEFFTGLSKPRNPEIMRVFKDLELVENLGSGVPAITKLYGREIFNFSESVTRISLKYEYTKSRVENEKSRVENEKSRVQNEKSRVQNEKSRVQNEKSRVQILELIKKNPNIKFTELSKILNISVKGIEKNIKLLKTQKLIKRVGPNKGGHWEVLK